MKKLSFLIPVFALVLLFSSCNDYGEKVSNGNVEAYYKDGITKEEAQKTADLIYNAEVASNNYKKDEQKSFQLSKVNGVIHLKMVVNSDKVETVNDYNFLAISNYVSDNVFNGAPIDMDLSDNKFKTIRTLPYKKLTAEDYEKAK